MNATTLRTTPQPLQTTDANHANTTQGGGAGGPGQRMLLHPHAVSVGCVPRTPAPTPPQSLRRAGPTRPALSQPPLDCEPVRPESYAGHSYLVGGMTAFFFEWVRVAVPGVRSGGGPAGRVVGDALPAIMTTQRTSGRRHRKLSHSGSVTRASRLFHLSPWLRIPPRPRPQERPDHQTTPPRHGPPPPTSPPPPHPGGGGQGPTTFEGLLLLLDGRWSSSFPRFFRLGPQLGREAWGLAHASLPVFASCRISEVCQNESL